MCVFLVCPACTPFLRFVSRESAISMVVAEEPLPGVFPSVTSAPHLNCLVHRWRRGFISPPACTYCALFQHSAKSNSSAIRTVLRCLDADPGIIVIS